MCAALLEYIDYALLAPEAKLRLFKSLSGAVIANDLQKLNLLHNHHFLAALLNSLVDTLAPELSGQIISNALIILNSLLYLTEDALPVLLNLNALNHLIQNAILLSENLLKDANDDVLILKNLSWNFKAFTKILYYDSNSIYNINDKFVDLIVKLLNYTPDVAADNSKKLVLLENEEAYHSCLFNLLNLIPNLSILSNSDKITIFPHLLDKILITTYSILESLLTPSNVKIPSNYFPSSPQQIAPLNSQLIKFLNTNSFEFRDFYFNNTLPSGSPVDLSLVPVYLPPLLYSLSCIMDLSVSEHLSATNDVKFGVQMLIEQNANEFNEVLPKNLYFVLAGFLNSDDLHLKLSSLNVLQIYSLRYINHLPEGSRASASKTLPRPVNDIFESDNNTFNSLNSQIIYHTVSKYLPYLMFLFNNSQTLQFSNDIPILKDHKPFNLLLGLCKFSSTDNHEVNDLILNNLDNYNVLPIIIDKILYLINVKIMKVYERNYLDGAGQSSSSSSSNKKQKSSGRRSSVASLGENRKFAKSDLFLSNETKYEDIDDTYFLLKYASVEDLEVLLNCFDILNCFMTIPNNHSYKQFILTRLINNGEVKKPEEPKFMRGNTSSNNTDNDNRLSSIASKSYLNNVNLLVINVLVLQLRVSTRLEKILLNKDEKKKLPKLLGYMNKSFFKILVINKLVQSVVNFLKSLSVDILLLRSFFIINFNKELIINLLIHILKLPISQFVSKFKELGKSADNEDNTINSIILPNIYLSSKTSNHSLLSGIISYISNFENFREILNSIVETKTLISLLLANLSLEFSPLQTYLLDNRLIEIIRTNLKANFMVNCELTLTAKEENTPPSKNEDHYEEINFISYIIQNNTQFNWFSQNDILNKTNQTKLEFINKYLSSDKQDSFQITDLTTNENFMDTNKLNFKELNIRICNIYNLIHGIGHSTSDIIAEDQVINTAGTEAGKNFGVLKNIVLKINYTDLVDFSKIYSLKLSNLIILKNLLYESSLNLKDNVLSKINFKSLLQPLLINNDVSTVIKYVLIDEPNFIKLEHMILDYQTQLFNVIRNLVSNSPKIISKLKQNISGFDEAGTVGAARQLKQEQLVLNLFIKNLTISNIIEKPKLVSNVLFIIVNVLTLKETYRNIIISDDLLLQKIKFILDLKLPNIQTDISDKEHDSILENFISVDLQRELEGTTTSIGNSTNTSATGTSAAAASGNAAASRTNANNNSNTDAKLVISPSSPGLSLSIKKDKSYKLLNVMKEKYQTFFANTDYNYSQASKSNNLSAAAVGGDTTATGTVDPSAGSNMMMMMTYGKFNTEYLNIKLACIWIIINLVWDQDDPELPLDHHDDYSPAKPLNEDTEMTDYYNGKERLDPGAASASDTIPINAIGGARSVSSNPLSNAAADSSGDGVLGIGHVLGGEDILSDARQKLTIIDRWKKLVDIGIQESLAHYKNSSVLDIKQRAIAALNNFDVIRQELDNL